MSQSTISHQSLPKDRPATSCSTNACQTQNVGNWERVGSVIGGSLLAMYGLSRGRASGLILGALGGALVYRGATGHCHGYEALGLDTSKHNDVTAVPAQQGLHVVHHLQINRTPKELYRFWRDVENLPQVLTHVETITKLDERRSRWTAKGPFGRSYTWEAEIFNDREPELIAWRSLPDSDIETAGSIRFHPLPADRGTAVNVTMKYNPPAGKVGSTIAWMTGNDIEQHVRQDLQRFKSLMEAQEVPTIEGQTHGVG